MSHTVHCFIPAAYTSLIKYEWATNLHKNSCNFTEKLLWMCNKYHKNFGVKSSTHDLLKITQDSILKSVLTEIHAT